MTDSNGLLYMRARYYNPELKRFVNADIIIGEITNSSTLNRYAYANGNPVSNIDPFGLSAERGGTTIYYGNVGNYGDVSDLSYSDLSKSQLMDSFWISLGDFFNITEENRIKMWKELTKQLSTGDMQDVLLEMINHFIDGTGNDYSNPILSNAVQNHEVTQTYMSDVIKVFTSFMNKYNGDYQAFANTDEFKKAMQKSGVYLSSYSYGGGLFDFDTWNGLTMAIHGWTESLVNLTAFNTNGNDYNGTMQFTFIDNFGLDEIDLKQFGIFAGFKSWYILQHYDEYDNKYRPFKTYVTLNYEFSGKITN